MGEVVSLVGTLHKVIIVKQAFVFEHRQCREEQAEITSYQYGAGHERAIHASNADTGAEVGEYDFVHVEGEFIIRGPVVSRDVDSIRPGKILRGCRLNCQGVLVGDFCIERCPSIVASKVIEKIRHRYRSRKCQRSPR